MKYATFAFIVIFLLWSSATYGQISVPRIDKSQDPSNPSYSAPTLTDLKHARGEVIVKLKSGILVQDTQFQKMLSKGQFGVSSLDGLNHKFRVSSIEPVFPRAKKPDIDGTVPFQGRRIRVPDLSGIFLLKVDPLADHAAVIKEYESDPFVEYAEPNYIFQTFETIPNEYTNRASLAAAQWGLDKVKAPEAWDIETGSDSVIIAIIDTGVDWDHPDLAANIWRNTKEIPDNGIDDDGNGYIDDIRGWDFVSIDSAEVFPGEDPGPRDNNPMDFSGHGTHVAGIAGAVTNNSFGVAGLAWHCKLMPLRSGFKDTTGSSVLLYSDILPALQYAADNGANVINMSFGTSYIGVPEPRDPIMTTLKLGIEYANAHGVVLVAAAGNIPIEGVNTYPAVFDGVISVAASDKDDKRACFSTFASWVSVAAPGVNIYSTIFDDKFATLCGTSMSTPLVSGLAGLVLSKNPNFSNTDVMSVIVNEIDPPASEQYIGRGRINAYKALLVNTRTNAIAKITTPNERAVIITPTVQVFGISTGARYTLEYGQGIYPSNWTVIASGNGAVNGELGLWNVATLQPGTYTLRLRVEDNSRTVIDRVTVAIRSNALPLHTGWPVQTGAGIHSSAVVADLDHDGQQEIILYAGDGNLYVWDNLGKNKPGWPKFLGTLGPASTRYLILMPTPAIADLDADGYLDIIVPSPDGKLHATNYLGNPLPGWPVQTGRISIGTPTVFDLDNDGRLEVICRYVIIGRQEGDGYLGVWNRDGKMMNGWPIKLPTQWGELAGYWSSQAVGDLDNDGDYEIIVGSQFYVDAQNRDNKIYAFHHNGQPVGGFPVDLNPSGEYLGFVSSSPAIADIDGDGKVEIVIGSDDKTGLWVLTGDGKNFPGWPKTFAREGSFFRSSPAVGDIDSDGKLEIIIGHLDWRTVELTLYAFKHSGMSLPGWPIQVVTGGGGFIFGWLSPILGDVDGDGRVDIVVPREIGDMLGTGGSEIYAFDRKGKPINGFPLFLAKPAYSAATLADVDRYGSASLLMGDLGGQLLIWNLPSGFNRANAPWPKFRHDNWNTGLYGFKPPPTVFRLVSPANNDTVRITLPPRRVKFAWGPSFSSDLGDTLWYVLYLTGPGIDTTVTGLRTTTVELDIMARLRLGSSYNWTVKVSDGVNSVASPDTFKFFTSTTVTFAEHVPEDIPARYSLAQNYPNPFNSQTIILFDLPKESHVLLKVYDVLGQQVAVVIDQLQPAGSHRVSFDASHLPSGVYFYRLQAGSFVETRKLLLMR